MSDAPSAHIDLTMRTAAFNARMNSVKKALAGLRQGLRRTSQVAKRMLLVGAIGFGGLLKMASDFEEFSSKFKAVFKGLTGEARAWAKETSKSLQRSEVDLIKYMGTLQDTFVPFGFARREAMEMTKAVTQLGIDLASFNNIADDDAIRNLTSAIVGNHEAVRRFGILITAVTLNQELLNMGIAGGSKAATEQQKVLARLNLIMKATADAQGDAAKTSGSFANQIKGLLADVKSLAIVLGGFFIPKMKELITSVREFIPKVMDWVKGNKDLIISTVKWVAGLSAAVIALNQLAGVAIVASTVVAAFIANPVVAGIIAFATAIGLAVTAYLALNEAGKAAARANKEHEKSVDELHETIAKAQKAAGITSDPKKRLAAIDREKSAVRELLAIEERKIKLARKAKDEASKGLAAVRPAGAIHGITSAFMEGSRKAKRDEFRQQLYDESRALAKASDEASKYKSELLRLDKATERATLPQQEFATDEDLAAEAARWAEARTQRRIEKEKELARALEERAKQQAAADAIALSNEESILAILNKIGLMQGTLTEKEIRLGELRRAGLKGADIKRRIELEEKLAGLQKAEAQRKERSSFTSAIEGATAVFRRIQTAAASGSTADPEGKARAALEAQKRGNTLTTEQTGILAAIKERLDGMKVAFS